MPTIIHESFAALVVDVIKTAIENCAGAQLGEDSLAQQLRAIEPEGSPTLTLQNRPGGQSPDAVFYAPVGGKSAPYPQVVVEVSYTQRPETVGTIADNYIVFSEHQIQCVLGFDIEYKKNEGKTGIVSIWRPDLVIDEDEPGKKAIGVSKLVSTESFCDANGDSIGGNLALYVSDFLTDESLPEIEISIPFADLAKCLKRAVDRQDAHTKQCAQTAKSTTSRRTRPTKFRLARPLPLGDGGP